MGAASHHRPWQYLLYVFKQLLRSRLAATCLILLLIILPILLVNFSVIKQSNSIEPAAGTSSSRLETQSTGERPLMFWIHHKTEQPLVHVISVFNRLGYVQGREQDNWDVLWAYQYPFYTLPHDFWARLQSHQKVNHFPGSGCFTFKPQLATMEFEFIPKAFQLPKEAQKFVAEAKAHPDQLWVQKDNNHRRIRIVSNINSVNLHGDGSFVQQFVGNPLLIDGRKFDIGVYTVITSVNPLRVYTYSEEVLVRFCSEDYEPFDPLRVKKYVVDDEYTRPSSVHSMATLLSKQSLSNKAALNVLLERKGFSPSDLWSQVDQAIRKVLLRCESTVVSHLNKLSLSSRHFFELVRFDFVIDDKLKAWLMEVNLSPNLSSDHFSENRHMYEQVIFNTLHLVGLARPNPAILRYNGHYESVMLVNDRDVQVTLKECVDGTCDQCSEREVCELCGGCKDQETTFTLKTTFLEHVSRRGFTRVYPPPVHLHDNSNSEAKTKQSHANHMMSTWFQEKCRSEPSWCF